ncbi:hypothetical protein [Sphingobacterium sp. SGG-5]|uniref:hypothetical protein n=1 Tax=Sphingobacterium sp. SGG-5 TaxID=2710881 RepID=UPI0019D0FE03|nr:hypothetical protein [Sphingobacterium sp. SGG-5]
MENGSFEKGDSDWKLVRGATLDTTNGYQSGSSLYIHNDDTQKKSPGASQQLEIAPGSSVYFTAKVRGRNLSADVEKKSSNGARIYIQAYDEFDKLIGGRYPKLSGLGTFDWKELSGEYTVPINAAYVSIGVGLYGGVAGEAWFDDISLRLEKPQFIEAFLMKPHYRGMIQEAGEQVFSERIVINRAYYDDNPAEIEVSYDLKNVVNKTIEKFRFKLPASAVDTVLTFAPKRKLGEGDYTLTGGYSSRVANTSFSRTHKIEVVRSWPAVYIDKEGYTIKGGKRIFPFGFYIGHPDDEHLDRIKKAGFNTILSYGYGHNTKYEEYLDKAAKYDLNVIYSIKDFYEGRPLKLGKRKPLDVARDYVNTIKHKPALLAWYTVDELLPEWIPKIEELYEEVRKIDPHHPTLQVHYYDGYRMLEKYYYNGDIIATDPYPVGRADLALTSTRVKAGLKATHNTRGHWAVLQSMDWAVYQKERKPNPPDLDELRNQCYQALIHGAKGILFYSYYDLFQERWPRQKELNYDNFNKLWPDIVTMSEEITALFPMLLHGKACSVEVLERNGIEISCIEYEGRHHLLIANPFYEEREISVRLPAGMAITQSVQGQIASTIEGETLKLRLPSIGSGIFTIK